jgi:succinoglycan biosynthesis transport protein ExoP
MTEAFSNRPTTVADYLAILRRRKWIVLLPPVWAAVVAYLLSTGQSPVYRATSQVFMNRAPIANSNNVPDPSFTDAVRFLATQASLARSPALADRVAAASSVSTMTPERVLGESRVTPSADADLLFFSVDDEDPQAATQVANAYASEFTRFTNERATNTVDKTLEELQRQIDRLEAQGQSGSATYGILLQDQARLLTIRPLLSDIASVLQVAEGAGKISPRPQRNATLGFLFGAVLGIALAMLAEALDRRVRDEHEIEAALGLPLLARVAKPSRNLQKSDDLVMLKEPASAHGETYRKLRTSIEFVNPNGALRTIMVTSAVEQEGKSTTIANLAVALARGNRRVALVDLDLRRPYLSRLFHVGSRPGITDVAVGQVSLADALRPIGLAPATSDLAARNGRKPANPSNGRSNVDGLLHLLPAGTIPPSAGELLQDERLLAVVDELATQFDFVLIDGPPLLAFGDAMTLSTHVDAIFAITRLGKVQRPILHEFARQLQNTQSTLLGYVLTGVEQSDSYRYMYEGYGYDVQKATKVKDQERV